MTRLSILVPRPMTVSPEGRAVDRRVGAELDVVLEAGDADLGDLAVPPDRPRRSRSRPSRRPRPRTGRSGSRRGSARARRRWDGACILADLGLLAHEGSRPQDRACTHTSASPRPWRPRRRVTPRPSRAVLWTNAPRATPGDGRDGGAHCSSQEARAAVGFATTTAGRPPACSGFATSRAPARDAAASPRRCSSATQERSAGPARSRGATPESEAPEGPAARPPRAAATSPSVKGDAGRPRWAEPAFARTGFSPLPSSPDRRHLPAGFLVGAGLGAGRASVAVSALEARARRRSC